MLTRQRGTGWSELQPGVQDAENIAIELHQVLKQAGEKEPFVLVAASVAGFYARQYVDAFPTEVAVNRDSGFRIYLPELIKRKHFEVRLEW